MGLLFAVSGYFARASLLRKGPALFLRDRLFRLGLPVILYMLVIGPVTEFYLAGSWRHGPGVSFFADWWRHITNGEVLARVRARYGSALLFLPSILPMRLSRHALTGARPPPGAATPNSTSRASSPS